MSCENDSVSIYWFPDKPGFVGSKTADTDRTESFERRKEGYPGKIIGLKKIDRFALVNINNTNEVPGHATSVEGSYWILGPFVGYVLCLNLTKKKKKGQNGYLILRLFCWSQIIHSTRNKVIKILIRRLKLFNNFLINIECCWRIDSKFMLPFWRLVKRCGSIYLIIRDEWY